MFNIHEKEITIKSWIFIILMNGKYAKILLFYVEIIPFRV